MKNEKFIIFLLLMLFATLAFFSSLCKAPVFDEGIHITGGYNALVNGDYRVNPENGLLPGALDAYNRLEYACILIFFKLKTENKKTSYNF